MPPKRRFFSVAKTRAANVSKFLKPTRAGVIMYACHKNILYFGLGIDANTHELTDFGGRADYNVDTNGVMAGLREFHEETLGIFAPLTSDDVAKSLVVSDDRNLIIFAYVPFSPNIISAIFNEQYRKQVDANNQIRDRKLIFNDINTNDLYDPEVCGITWLTLDEFQECISTPGKLYSRVQKFLAKAGAFTHLL